MNVRKACAALMGGSICNQRTSINYLAAVSDNRSSRTAIKIDVARAAGSIGGQKFSARAARDINILSQPIMFLDCPGTDLIDRQPIGRIKFHNIIPVCAASY
jgi:hypothetical protein